MIHIAAPFYCKPGEVFISILSDEADWDTRKAKDVIDANKEHIIECAAEKSCHRPAARLDHHWPYGGSGANACIEHILKDVVCKEGYDRWRNPAFKAAYIKGWAAYFKLEPKTNCPYPDHRTDRGSVTFSRAFIREWEKGWDDAEERYNG